MLHVILIFSSRSCTLNYRYRFKNAEIRLHTFETILKKTKAILNHVLIFISLKNDFYAESYMNLLNLLIHGLFLFLIITVKEHECITFLCIAIQVRNNQLWHLFLPAYDISNGLFSRPCHRLSMFYSFLSCLHFVITEILLTSL